MGHPCLTELWIGIGWDHTPFIINVDIALAYIRCSLVQKFSLKIYSRNIA